jgi:acetyl-CoA synthetase
VTALGSLKAGCVLSPLFSAFGPDPIRQRMQIGQGRLLVTTLAAYRRKVALVRESLPDLQHVLLVDLPAGTPVPPGTASLAELMSEQNEEYEIGATDPESPALLHFTRAPPVPRRALSISTTR